ncbi:hypothetical protein HZS_3940, partial [Henneguya salminicola]
MLIKFETKSNRVKGIFDVRKSALSFHNKRPWLLASLYNGTIQLWDHRLCTLIEKFDEHEGPIRGLHFHPEQPLFVSGGDDTHIKVWNYEQLRCLFTLFGHLDYVRTTFFHSENPWIISASDDNTIRIWNWQSRACISVITGHNHYVMCAQFHPNLPLIVSCSLDQTIRLWDMTALKNKFFSPSKQNENSLKMSSIEILAPMDVVTKNILEGHERGLNWVSFHPTQPLIISCSDDRSLKIWRFSENGAFEIDTLRGHYNNVCCATFSHMSDVIISVSEDKSLRVWDSNKYTYLATYRRDVERFWCIASSPTSSLFAAGHDNGILFFKLSREKPAFDVFNNQVIYMKNRFVKKFDPESMKDSVVCELKKTHARQPPIHIGYNPVENMILLNYSCRSEGADSHYIELASVPTGLKSSSDPSEVMRYNSMSSVWVSRNRIASVDKNGAVSLFITIQLSIRNTKNDSVNILEIGQVDAVFYAGTGFILAQMGDKVSLIDAKDNYIVSSIFFGKVRFVQWSSDFTRVALVSKRDIIICTKKLEILTTHSEVNSIKSCTFVSGNISIVLFTTPCHIKYIIVPSGDYGIVRTLDVVLYIVHAKDKNISFLDREVKPRILTIDNTEYLFKLALLEERYEEVLRIIRSSNLVGQALISFVREKGLPEIALHFIKDTRTKFLLSLECCNMEIALEMAKHLDDPDCWKKLASSALKLGNIQIAEECYIRVKDFHHLSFLYVITGNTEKLERLPKSDNNINSIMISYMYTNNIEGLVKILSNSNDPNLAWALASNHSLSNAMDTLKPSLSSDIQPNFSENNKKPFFNAPQPQFHLTESWPKLAISKNIFDIISDSNNPNYLGNIDLPNMDSNELFENPNDVWNEDIDVVENNNGNLTPIEEEVEEEQQDAWNLENEEVVLDDELLEIPLIEISIDPKPIYTEEYIKSNLPVVQIMTGSFQSAFRYLSSRFGIINFEPLKTVFISTYINSKLLIPSFLPCQYLVSYPSTSLDLFASCPINISQIQSAIQSGFQLTTSGKFSEAMDVFLDALYKCMLVVIINKKELNEIISLVRTCKEYIVGLSLELERRSLQNAPNRSAELAAYFTQCDLQPTHTVLVLRIAMNLMFKLKNYKTTSVLAKRVLDLAPSTDICNQARKLIAVSEKNGLSNEIQLNYDELNPSVVCC